MRGSRLKLWKTKPEPFAADARELRLGELRDIDAVETVVAAGRPVEATEDRHQRRLARSRRAHDGDELAALDGQADAAQRMHVDVADVIGPRDVLDSDDRLRHVVMLPLWLHDHSRGRGTLDRPFCRLLSARR